MKMKFENSVNGYIEEVDGAWFYTLLFGCFYFAYKGAWVAAILTFFLSLVTVGLSWLILPFFADEIVRKSYLQRGWRELTTVIGDEAAQNSPKRSADHERKLAEVKKKMGW